MSATQAQCHNSEDQDYIDMEVSSSCSSSSSSSNFISFTISSPPHITREFEFQMCSSASNSSQPTSSPADELFYKGKLLPLHLPPRIEMVQNLLLQNPNPQSSNQDAGIASITSVASSASNLSPCESRRVSSEINPDECFFELSSELNAFIDVDDRSKVSWTTRKLKQIKQSLISQKIKASRSYIRSWFNKSACSDKFSATATFVTEAETAQTTNDGNKNKYRKLIRKNPFGKIETFDDNGDYNIHRRSFSGVIQRHCPTKCLSSGSSSSSSSLSSSSSFSFSSNGSFDLMFLKRSSSANSEIENSVEGAIAHCKQSLKHFSPRESPRKSANDQTGFCSYSDSRIGGASGDTARSELCRV